MNNLSLYISTNLSTVKSAPCGLFYLEGTGEVLCLSEYQSEVVTINETENIKENPLYKRDAYIVSTGESYCGDNNAKGYSLLIQ